MPAPKPHIDEMLGGSCYQCRDDGKKHEHSPARCEVKDCERFAHSYVCWCGKYHAYGRVHYRNQILTVCEVHHVRR